MLKHLSIDIKASIVYTDYAMRTTLTLDDDVSILLDRRQAELSVGFKELVNSLLRASLAAETTPTTIPQEKQKFSTPVFHGHNLVAGEMTSVADMLALGEGEDFR